MTLYSTDVEKHTDVQKVIIEEADEPATSFYRTAGKRALDLTLVLLSAPAAAVLIGVLALAVLATGQNPFYVQKRVGKNGKMFNMVKLRTMLPNAEQRLSDFLAKNEEARAEWESKQKLIHDPRVTPLGNWLRKTSLDELPQLINVLTGTMSLVGPRPMMPEQEKYYYGSAYYELRPGMTGLWQISDRNDCAFKGRVQFDETYNRTLSFLGDVRVLAETVRVVLKGTGV